MNKIYASNTSHTHNIHRYIYIYSCVYDHDDDNDNDDENLPIWNIDMRKKPKRVL